MSLSSTLTRLPIAGLKPHPGNPRIGDVEAITESLVYHGQFRPVVVSKRTGTVIAGWHTTLAARGLGWKEIDAVVVDVDNTTATRIMLADNRTSDLASYADDRLIDVLNSLPDLAGTGFGDEELADLLESGGEELAPEAGASPESESSGVECRIGKWCWQITDVGFTEWNHDLMEEADGSRRRGLAAIRARLGIPKPTRPDKTSGTAPQPLTRIEMRPLNTLTRHPANPREGDVGAITESLREFGQYRPVVVDGSGTVLVGNHTVEAAEWLGWEEVAAVVVDVDEDTATRIMLADNRTADAGGYDQGALARLLTSTDLTGTGFDQDDVATVLAGGRPSATGARGRVTLKLGDYRTQVRKPVFHAWAAQITAPIPERELIARLGMQDSECSIDYIEGEWDAPAQENF